MTVYRIRNFKYKFPQEICETGDNLYWYLNEFIPRRLVKKLVKV